MPSSAPDPAPRRRILVDTNGWFLPVRAGTDLLGEIDRLLPGAEVLVPTPVLRELEDLVEREVPGAPVALRSARSVGEYRSRGRGDAAVLDAAVRSGAWVLTADRALGERLRAVGVSVLVPRDRTRLAAHAAPVHRGRRATVKKRPTVRSAARRRRGHR